MLTAICLMTDVTGAPVNSCYLLPDNNYYTMPEQCNAMLYQYEMAKRRETIEQVGDQAIVVVMTSCVEASNV